MYPQGSQAGAGPGLVQWEMEPLKPQQFVWSRPCVQTGPAPPALPRDRECSWAAPHSDSVCLVPSQPLQISLLSWKGFPDVQPQMFLLLLQSILPCPAEDEEQAPPFLDIIFPIISLLQPALFEPGAQFCQPAFMVFAPCGPPGPPLSPPASGEGALPSDEYEIPLKGI